MKVLSGAILASLLLALNSHAQYLSDGWKPGQAVTTAQVGHAYEPSAAGQDVPSTVEESKKKGSIFDLSTYLEAGPLKTLFNRAGINVTEKLEAARERAKIWNDDIPLLTDENYEGTVVEEHFGTLEEERDRLWFIVMYVST